MGGALQHVMYKNLYVIKNLLGTKSAVHFNIVISRRVSHVRLTGQVTGQFPKSPSLLRPKSSGETYGH